MGGNRFQAVILGMSRIEDNGPEIKSTFQARSAVKAADREHRRKMSSGRCRIFLVLHISDGFAGQDGCIVF